MCSQRHSHAVIVGILPSQRYRGAIRLCTDAVRQVSLFPVRMRRSHAAAQRRDARPIFRARKIDGVEIGDVNRFDDVTPPGTRQHTLRRSRALDASSQPVLCDGIRKES